MLEREKEYKNEPSKIVALLCVRWGGQFSDLWSVLISFSVNFFHVIYFRLSLWSHSNITDIYESFKGKMGLKGKGSVSLS